MSVSQPVGLIAKSYDLAAAMSRRLASLSGFARSGGSKAGFRRLPSICRSFSPPRAAFRTNIRSRFHAIVARLHSPRALARPRIGNRRKPMTDLTMPDTGSGVCLRSAWSARPGAVFLRCAMASAGAGFSGAGGGPAKRSSSGG